MTRQTDERLDAALDICDTLRRAGHRALLAGGCVRDLLLDRRPKDYDVATSATPEEVAKLFSRCVEVGAQFGVQIVIMPPGPVEVTTFRMDGPYRDGRHPEYVEFSNEVEDARRRDFTINALFYDPDSERVIDYVSGREDLDRGIIRAVGNPFQRFTEDHLRLLRAIRFAARLGYQIEEQTLESIHRLAPLIVMTSAERIRDELVKMLTEGGARRAFELMDNTGLLAQVLPEVAAMRGVAQPPEFHPEGDVYIHTLLALEHLKDASPALAVGVLLHDVGKPGTQTFEDRIRFNNHDKLGARMADDICRRLRMPREVIEQVSWMIENHMRVSSAPGMRESKLKRFVRHPWFGELLELCRIDCLASHGDVSIVEWLRDFVENMPGEQLKPPRILTGADLIDMGYNPSPLFSEILSSIEDAQLEGKLREKSDAMEFVKRNWPLPQSN
jgi:poly(A) polymerase